MIVASIDIGTNTVLLLIAKAGNKRKLQTILDEYRIPRVGKGLLPDKNISDDRIHALFNVLNEYYILIKDHKCDKVVVTATNALRTALNGKEIAHRITDEFGWNVNIVTGVEEANLSYLGAVSGINNKSDKMVIDIGGGSTELTIGTAKEMKFRESFHTGVVSGSERFFKNDPPLKSEIDALRKHLSDIFSKLKTKAYAPIMTIALAGTPTTLACMKQNLEHFDEEKVEGSKLSYIDVKEMVDKLSVLSSYDILNEYKAIVSGRQDLILTGAVILLFIMDMLKIDNVFVSTKGLRYGAILSEVFDR